MLEIRATTPIETCEEWQSLGTIKVTLQTFIYSTFLHINVP